MVEYEAIVVGAGPAGATAGKILAQKGHRVLIIDRAKFPRPKPCAGWVNIKALREFPWLGEKEMEWTQCPFYGIVFLSPSLRKRASYFQNEPAGYLVQRSKFDKFLLGEAISSGCEFIGGAECRGVEVGEKTARVILADGRSFPTEIIIGADGARSPVARETGLRQRWRRKDLAVCVAENISLDEAEIDALYGKRRALYVALRYSFIPGYAWAFPKRDTVSVGVGAKIGKARNIARIYEKFFTSLKKVGLLPARCEPCGPSADVVPVGGAISSRTYGPRVLLVGDAGGFASASTGEGIYPGMKSARFAAEIASKCLASGKIDENLREFEPLWQKELLSHIENPPAKARYLLDFLFREKRFASKLARRFLFGEGAPKSDTRPLRQKSKVAM